MNGMNKDDLLSISAVLRKQVAAVRQATVTASINDRAVLLAEAEALDREIIALEANEGRRQAEKKG